MRGGRSVWARAPEALFRSYAQQARLVSVDRWPMANTPIENALEVRPSPLPGFPREPRDAASRYASPKGPHAVSCLCFRFPIRGEASRLLRRTGPEGRSAEAKWWSPRSPLAFHAEGARSPCFRGRSPSPSAPARSRVVTRTKETPGRTRRLRSRANPPVRCDPAVVPHPPLAQAGQG